MAPTYSFPILGNNDIIACLAELDIAITEKELLRPHPDTLFKVYEDLVVLLCGETREEMYTPNLEAAANCLEFPELYEEAIGALKFHRHLFALMKTVGVPDFSMRDMTKPEYARTRRNISAIINFAKFRETLLEKHEDIMEEAAKQEAAYDAAAKRNAELKAQIERLKAQQEAEDNKENSQGNEPVVQDCTPEELAEATRVRDEAKANYESWVIKKEESDAKLEAARKEEDETKAAVIEAEAKKAELEKLAAENELKAKGTEAERAAAAEIAEEQRLLDEAQDKLKALEEKQRKGKESLEEIKKLIEYCKEVEIDVNKAVEAEARVKRLELEVNEAEEQVFEQDQKIDDLKRQETTWTEKIARQKEQGELKRQAAEASLKAAREELAAVKARNTANDAKKAEEVNQARQLELKMQKEDEEHNREVQSLVMNFASLRDQVAKYHAQIADEMGVSENERVPLQRVENFGKNGDLDNTFGWTNYDMTKNFGGIGKGKPSIAAVGRPAGAEDTEFTLS